MADSPAPSRFSAVRALPPNAIFDLSTRFKADSFPSKIDLGVGAYRDASLKPYVFPAVAKAEYELEGAAHEYTAIAGISSYRRLAAELTFGSDSELFSDNRVTSIQTVGGTGALRIAFEVVKRTSDGTVAVYLPNPTWGNHKDILTDVGFSSDCVRYYTYFDPASCGLAITEMMSNLGDMPEGSAVLLHVCAHNPTGVDPTTEQWDAILDLCQRRNLLVVFDMAYLGFASGDVVRDGYAVRRAVSIGLEFFVAQSFSKNMGLYGERVGCLHLVTSTQSAAEALLSVAAVFARRMYSNPPIHGGRIVARILGDSRGEGLLTEWKDQLRDVVNRIASMRECLVKELVAAGAPGDWSHITKQIGMFSYTGLSKDVVKQLVEDWHIYMLSNGRISLAGLNEAACVYVAKAVTAVLTGSGDTPDTIVGAGSGASSDTPTAAPTTES